MFLGGCENCYFKKMAMPFFRSTICVQKVQKNAHFRCNYLFLEIGPHIARYCDTIAAISHIARYFFREVSSSPKWCDTPPWCLVSHRHICAIPHFATYRAIIVRYPHKNKHERVLRYYLCKYRAI